MAVARMLSLYETDEMLRRAGAERVSEDASKKLCEVLEDSAKDILQRAKTYARHAGRKNIGRKDILLAAGMNAN